MPWTPITNLKGPKGDQGSQGPQGLAGVNGVANDAATASYINTAGTSATKTALDAGYLAASAVDQVFQGYPLVTYGHSFLAEQGLSDATKYYARLLATAFGMTYPTLSTANDLKRAVGGTRAEEAGQRLVGTGAPWVNGMKAVVLIESLINTARLRGIDAPSFAGAKRAVEAMCAVISSSSRIENSDPMFTYSGMTSGFTGAIWSGGGYAASTALGDSVTFTVPKANCWFLTNARPTGLAGVTINFTNESAGGAIITTYANQDMATTDVPNTYANAAIRLNVPAGTIVKARSVSGGGTFIFDALLVPADNPTPIVLMKEPYLKDYSLSTQFPNGSDAALDYFNAIYDQVAAQFPNVIVADPNTAGYWDKNTGIQSDGVHPNEIGNQALFLTARDAIRKSLAKRAIAYSVQKSYGLA